MPLTPATPATTSEASASAVLLLLVDFLGLGDFDLTLKTNTKQRQKANKCTISTTKCKDKWLLKHMYTKMIVAMGRKKKKSRFGPDTLQFRGR